VPLDQASIYRDRIYGSYHSGRSNSNVPDCVGDMAARVRYFRRLAKRHFSRGNESKIVDLGCGYGAFLYALTLDGYRHVRGIDSSAEQVSAARRLGISNVEKREIMPFLAEIESESLDVVLSFDVIEHFTKNELINLVDEVHRVLRWDGCWVLHVPNAEGPFSALIRYADFTHELAFTRVSLDQLLRASRFSKVSCFEDRPIVHGPQSAARYLLWRMIRLLLLGYSAIETGKLDHGAIFSQNLLCVASK